MSDKAGEIGVRRFNVLCFGLLGIFGSKEKGIRFNFYRFSLVGVGWVEFMETCSW